MNFELEFQAQIEGIAQEINSRQEEGTLFESDYLENFLDVEIRCNLRKEINSVEVCIGFGGPNIFIDTAKRGVCGYWGGLEAFAPISGAACDDIDDYFRVFLD